MRVLRPVCLAVSVPSFRSSAQDLSSIPLMDPGGSTPVKRQDDDDSKSDVKRDVKPVVKTLNRVPRKLSSCRMFFVSLIPFHRRLCEWPFLFPPVLCAYLLDQNACRKQKMRCEGADNPPCRRCRNTGLECLFEKPSREATLTGEAGLEYVVCG